MPLYDYDCSACGRRFEVIHGVDGDPPASCLLCGSGPVRKAFAAPAIHFKGSGWAKKERRSAARAKEPTREGAESDSSSGAAEKATAGTSNVAGDATAASDTTPTSSKPTPSRPSPPTGGD